MFELLTHEAVINYLSDDEWTVNEAFIDIPNVRNPKYSDALTELIRLCLEPEPWDRPSIEELELKIETRCQSIANEYAANPSLHQQDRLYYRGSEINQMPPGNWNYWNPLMEYVPRPSEPPDREKDPKNPFTNTIIYPPFPTSELDGPEAEGEEVQDDNDAEKCDKDGDDGVEAESDEVPKGLNVNGAGNLDATSADPSRGPRGNDAKNPLVISDSDENPSHGPKGNDAKNPLVISGSDESSESHGSEEKRSSGAGSDDSVDSDDSDVRRRMAIKTLPGT